LDSSLRHILALNDIIYNNIKNIILFKDFVKYKSEGKNTLEYLNYKGISNASEIFNKWIGIIENDKYLKFDVLFNDSLFFLESISKNDCYLVTERKNVEGLYKQIDKFNIQHFFKRIIPVNNEQTKAQATKEINFDVIIGDTENDLEWALYKDSIFYPLNRGYRSKNYWSKKNIISYENLIEILNLIKR